MFFVIESKYKDLFNGVESFFIFIIFKFYLIFLFLKVIIVVLRRKILEMEMRFFYFKEELMAICIYLSMVGNLERGEI